MAPNERYVARRRLVPQDGHYLRERLRDLEEPSIGELVERMAADTSRLVRLEARLARAEMRETQARVKEMATRVAVGAAVGVAAAVALTAFLVIALAEAIDSWSASALIVGVVMLVVAWLLVRQGMARVEGRLGLPRTKESLAESARWGKEELRAFKREFTA